VEIHRYFRSSQIDAMTVFNCCYFVLYVFVPLNVMLFGEDVVRQKYAFETFGAGDLSTSLALLLSYLSFCLGYWAKSRKKFESPSGNPRAGFSLEDSAHVAHIIFLLGVLTTVIYVVQIGGLAQVITMATEITAKRFAVESKYIFYRNFSQFSADAFVLFFAVLIGKKVRNFVISKWDRLFLFCAFVFFVYYAASTGERRPFIYPIILCFLVAASAGLRVKKWAVLAFALVFLFAGLGSMISMLGSVDSLPGLVEITSDQNASWPALFELAYDHTTQGLADSYIHFVSAQKASLWQFGFLTDIVNLPNDLLPSQLLGFQRTTHMHGEVNQFLLGYEPGEDEPGGENLGLHGYLLVNFGYVGMFTAFFCLGLLYKWIHLRFKPAELKDSVGWLIYWWIILAFFVYFREGVLMFVIKLHLTWWLTIAFLFRMRTKHIAKLSTDHSFEGIRNSSINQG
jgi:hypothetical protein